ncbi:MAG: glucose-6-phosphate isomerase [Myxococcaceae bacterium]
MGVRLSLDVNLVMASMAGSGGLSPVDLKDLAPKVHKAIEAVGAQHKAGKLEFLGLPSEAKAADAAVSAGRDLATHYENVVVLGIGGSSLGPKALNAALRHPFHNLLPPEQREGQARLFFPDNSDPSTFAGLLDVLDLKRTAFVAITKSGGTAETWAQLLYVHQLLTQKLGEAAARQQIVAVTDPVKGALRAVAEQQGWRTLSVPPGVGGRFSVLTPVGLLPAAAAGIEVSQVLLGAQEMQKRCEASDWLQNPGALLGALLYAMDVRLGRKVHVFMPYADALRETADWFVQLWAESLGKTPSVGPTPLRAIGATDQHSLLQLLMEGPHDKMTVFVGVDSPRQDLEIPRQFVDQPDVAYLGGHRFHALLTAEQRATALALAQAERPSCTIQLPSLTPRAMGELILLLEYATAIAGLLYGVNAYDQPGVEAGKRYACGLLGRPGYEEARKEIESRPLPQSALILS